MKTKILLCLLCLVPLVVQAQQKNIPAGYIDLDLPSGVLWKATNESGVFEYDAAVQKFGDKLPTQEQWSELKDYCDWTWTGSGYKVTGPNGKFIILSAAGSRWCNEYAVEGVNARGCYWSSTIYDKDIDGAWHLEFDSEKIDIYGSGDGSQRCHAFSVRLVQEW